MDGLVPGSSGLSSRLTRFFGREIEVAGVQEAVERDRLVTLVGAPGCGKTRLATEVGALLAARFPGGAQVAELAHVSDPTLVVNAVASAVGVHEQPGRPRLETLIETLATAELLLVVDNCEHVVGPVADLVGRVLAACPAIRVLGTSRVALGIPGERVWRVPPLDPATAVELFADRAGLTGVALEVDGATLSTVESVCRRLAGLPLAIELAAAWTRVLSPGQILDRLTDAVPLLRSSAHGVSARRRTMEATVDWSYRLLGPSVQQLFDRLSVFAGTFDLAAVETIASASQATGDRGASPSDALRDLTSLVDHSLVLVDEPGRTTEPTTERTTESMRYRVLEPVRQCGAAKLAERGGTDAVRRRHAGHYLAVAERWDVELRSGRRATALRRLEIDDGNLLAALAWSRDHDPGTGLRLASALARSWELRGRVNEGRRWLEDVLERATDDQRLRATALSRIARLAWRQRDYVQARALLQESLAITHDLGDELAVARRRRDLALVAVSERDAAQAVQLSERSIATLRALGDDQGLVWALEFLGLARYVAGDLADGDAHIEEALDVNLRVGNDAATAAGLLYRCYAADIAGDVAAERAHLVGALAALRRMGGPVEEPDWLFASSYLAAAEGRASTALRLAGAAEALSRRGGSYMNEPFIVPLDQRLADAGHEVGTAAADRLRAEGARMTLDELMSEALAEPGDGTDHPLTPREQEVAGLVAQGLNNVEIAGRLFISRRTVESHVEHIKRKLTFTTRHQIVAWAMHETPATPDHP